MLKISRRCTKNAKVFIDQHLIDNNIIKTLLCQRLISLFLRQLIVTSIYLIANLIDLLNVYFLSFIFYVSFFYKSFKKLIENSIQIVFYRLSNGLDILIDFLAIIRDIEKKIVSCLSMLQRQDCHIVRKS
jgi:hypothetical protein